MTVHIQNVRKCALATSSMHICYITLKTTKHNEEWTNESKTMTTRHLAEDEG